MRKVKLTLMATLLIMSVCFTACGNDEKVKEVDKTEEKEQKKKGYIHDYFDTSKFDVSKYSGKIYAGDGVFKSFNEIEEKFLDYTEIVVYDESIEDIEHTFYYYLTDEILIEKEAFARNTKEKDDDLEYIKETLGDPTCIYEWYQENDDNETFGTIELVYDYTDYVLILTLDDYTLLDTNPIPTISFHSTSLVTKEKWLEKDTNSKVSKKYMDENYKLYGKEITE